jgi:hypothetical protein
MEKELQRFLQILEKLQSQGVNKISKDDLDFFIKSKFSKPEDKAALERYDSLSKEDKVKPENVKILDDIMLRAGLDQKDALLDQAAEMDKQRKTTKITTGLNLLLSGADLATAQGQINRFEQGLKKSRRPGRPPVLTRDSYLAQAKADAQKDTMSDVTAIEAAKSGIQDSYLEDLQNARIASGGQSGAFGAYAQSAATRRGRRSLELAPIGEQIYQGRKERMDRLAGMSTQENQAINESAARYYPTDMSQYQFEQQQLANLGQTGFANRRDSMYGLASQVPGMVPYNRKYNDLKNQYASLGLADKTVNDIMEAEKNLQHRYNRNVYGIDIKPQVPNVGRDYRTIPA